MMRIPHFLRNSCQISTSFRTRCVIALLVIIVLHYHWSAHLLMPILIGQQYVLLFSLSLILTHRFIRELVTVVWTSYIGYFIMIWCTFLNFFELFELLLTVWKFGIFKKIEVFEIAISSGSAMFASTWHLYGKTTYVNALVDLNLGFWCTQYNRTYNSLLAEHTFILRINLSSKSEFDNTLIILGPWLALILSC